MRAPRRPGRRSEVRPRPQEDEPEEPSVPSSSPSDLAPVRPSPSNGLVSVGKAGRGRRAENVRQDGKGRGAVDERRIGNGRQAAQSDAVVEITTGDPSWTSRLGVLGADEEESKPVDMTERRRERLAERHRARKRRLVRAAIAAAVALVVAWTVFFSPMLALRSGGIAVEGADLNGSTVTAGQVRSAVNEYVGTPLIRLNTGDVEESVQKSLPMVKRVKVTRSFPGGIKIAVSLRRPVACLSEKGSCTAVDEDGVRLDIPKSRASSLPKLKLSKGDAASATSTMVNVLGALDDQTRKRIATVEVSDTGQVSFTLSNRATVAWGDAKNSSQKARVLKVLLTQKAKRYDVSAPGSPITEN